MALPRPQCLGNVPEPLACGAAYLMLLLSAEGLCRVQTPQARARPNQAVLRGGGWNNNALNVRAPNRNRNAPANRNDNIGFRCAKTPRPAVVEVPESLSFTDAESVRGGV